MHHANQTTQEVKKLKEKEWSHNLHVCPATIHHTEAVFSIVRVIFGRGHDDTMDDLDVNAAIWCIFLNATLRAAVHLGQVHEANLRYVKNHFWNSVGHVINENDELIGEQKENHWCKHTKIQRTHVDADKLIVQLGLPDHQRPRCRKTHGRHFRSHSLGFGDWSISFRTEQNRWTQERATEKPVGSCQAKHA